MLGDQSAIEGDWLVALYQQSGRGRQGRSWVSVEGNFFGTTLVCLRGGDPPAQTLSLAAGLALVEALDLLAPDQRVTLKWPNDVMIEGGKLAGILLERSGERIAVGFGVNLASAPDLPDRKSASLKGVILPQAFAPLLAGSFSRLLDLWRVNDTASLGRAWQARAHPVGSPLTVHSSSEETLSGRFDGLEPDGALRLRLDDGSIEFVRAGDVQLG